MKKVVFTVLMLVVTSFTLFADSPLTSTHWWYVYENNPIISEAYHIGYTDAVLNMICDEDQPLDLRLATANALVIHAVEDHGWENENHYYHCINYYIQKNGLTLETVIDHLSPETSCVFAYLLAIDETMSDFDFENTAHIMATQAQQKKPTSKGIAMIKALIEAQYDDDYCAVTDVANNQTLENDIPENMVDQMTDYVSPFCD